MLFKSHFDDALLTYITLLKNAPAEFPFSKMFSAPLIKGGIIKHLPMGISGVKMISF